MKIKIRISNKQLMFFSIIFILLVVFLFVNREPPPPREFVTNRTSETFESFLIKYEITKYPTSVNIVYPEKNISVGLIGDPWNLNFGRVPAGKIITGIRRFILLTNNAKENVKIKFKVYGNISPLVSFSKNDFILKPNQNLTIDVILHVSENVPVGNYSGEIDVIILKPKYNFVKFLLGV
jgi:hypothetical protein